MSKLGTEARPIRLLPDNALRTELIEHTSGLLSTGDLVVDLSKMKPPKLELDIYIKNLIRNPYLSGDEIRLGFLIFDLLDKEAFSPVFLTVPHESYRFNDIGEEGLLFVEASRSVSHNFELIEKQSLSDIARKNKLNISQTEMINILNKLHSFFYLTCTEVCIENLASNRVAFKYSKEEILLSESAKVIHIRINDRFDKLMLTRFWKMKPR